METLIETTTTAAAWVANNSLAGSLLLGAFLLMFLVLGRHLAPTLRVVLWSLVGLRLLLPFAPSSDLSIHNLLPSPKTAEAMPVVTPSASDSPVSMEAAMPIPTVTPTAPVPLEETSFPASLTWENALALGWAGIALGLMGIALARQRSTHRRIVRLPLVNSERLHSLLADCARRSGVKRRLRLVAAPPGSGVAVFGFLRVSHLVVPADLEERYSETEIRGILLHELAHVRRGDLLINWIVLGVQCLHWFNPLVWLAGRRFLADREVLCDRAALRGLPSEQRRDYGSALLKALQLGRTPRPCPALVPFVSRKSELEHRLIMIANPRSRSLLLQLTAGVFAIVVAITTFTSARADEERGERNERNDRRESARDGEREGGERSREGARDGEAATARADHEVMVFRDGVSFGGRKFTTMADFRNALRGQSGTSAVVAADPDAPFQTVNAVIDALKASGIREVILAQLDGEGRGGMRDGDQPREGARDGDRPREGARDGDRPREGEMRREGDGDGGSREGARDGDREGGERSREGARDGDRPREGEMRREGDGDSREGTRDGDRPREGEGARDGDRSREGARDGDRPREGEMRREGDGEGGSREGARDGESSAAEASEREINQWTRIYGAYDKDGDRAVTFEEWVSMKNYELTSDQRDREKGWFDEADGNGDEKVTLGEWIDWKASQGRRG